MGNCIPTNINIGNKQSSKLNTNPNTQMEGQYALPSNLRSYITFKGNAPKITKATLVTPNSLGVDIEQTKNGGYIVEPKTETELIYGKDAIEFLKGKDKFEYDTQITFPKNAEGLLISDGNIIKIKENSTILLNKDTEAVVTVDKGYPHILMSKKDYPWYIKHSNDKNQPKALKDKFKELVYRNSHIYNGEFKTNIFSKNTEKNQELKTKLINAGEVEEKKDDYIRFNRYSVWTHKKEDLKKKGFNEEELNIIKPIYEKVRQAKMDAKISLKCENSGLSKETIKKLEDNDILFKNKKGIENIYWKTNFESEEFLRKKLEESNIVEKEQEQVVRAWNTDNKIGFDLTGLKFINDNIAVYCLDDKINNWTLEPSCWVTNSTELSNKKTAPSVGTSIVQADESTPTLMAQLRNGEHLHKHPNLPDKTQTEIYLITSGSAALTVMNNGEPKVKILREGELAIISPETPHCVNSVMGEYEQIVSQIPSAFQYGMAFKENINMPEGFNETDIDEDAKKKLNLH